MRKFTRGPEPEVLKINCETWGTTWEGRRQSDNNPAFYWPAVDGTKLNHLLLPLLKAQTQEHCSFCDNFPVSPPSLETIEHFRPKTSFPKDAYRWTNLYYCCNACQQKGAAFEETLLRPDAVDFRFDRYFRWDFTRGTLEPNEHATNDDQQRARITIDLYRLNDGHPTLRRMWLRRYAQLQGEDIDLLPYRDYVRGPTC